MAETYLMSRKERVKLIDLSKCTGCRSCQVACKQWNAQPASQTKNRGSYQNPPDLEQNTWTLIRFQEKEKENSEIDWVFRKDGCMHCSDAACVRVCPTGALSYGEMGAVRLNHDLCIGCRYCTIACPFDIPRYDTETKLTYKCTLCEDRITQDVYYPACVQACPTGALSFDRKETMIPKAEKRVAELREMGYNASLYGKDYLKGTHVMYILTEEEKYYAGLPVKPRITFAVKVWRNIAKPLGLLSIGAVIGAALLHYFIKGPKEPK